MDVAAIFMDVAAGCVFFNGQLWSRWRCRKNPLEGNIFAG